MAAGEKGEKLLIKQALLTKIQAVVKKKRRPMGRRRNHNHPSAAKVARGSQSSTPMWGWSTRSRVTDRGVATAPWGHVTLRKDEGGREIKGS